MLKRNVQKMMIEANSIIETVSVHQALEWVDDPKVAFLDVREAGERVANGSIPGALHAPRSHLEFHADPEAALHNPVFASGKRLILFCASGGRSTLATKTLMDMGFTDVAHIAGGFGAWREAGGPVESIE